MSRRRLALVTLLNTRRHRPAWVAGGYGCGTSTSTTSILGGRAGAGGGVTAHPRRLALRSAHKAEGRFVVNIQSDGDMMYAPGVLLTARITKFRISQ